MKAIVLTQPGGPENLELRDVPTPEPEANELLIQVKAISINPVDGKTRKGGSLYEKLKEDGDVIIGWDVSGIVRSVGSEVKKFKVGDEVFGMINFPGKGRAYAEYVVSPENHVALKPSNISHVQAAACTLAAITAWQALVHHLKLQKGETILIHAAAGGVGHFAVQIAKHIGAYIIGTSSAANIDFIKSLGVNKAVDYHQQNFEDVVKDVDAVLDAVGGDVGIRSLKTIRKSGRLVSILPGSVEALKKEAANYDLTAWGFLVQSNDNDMNELAQLLQQGIIIPRISHQLAFEEMSTAHQLIETGRTRGKIVLTL